MQVGTENVERRPQISANSWSDNRVDRGEKNPFVAEGE